MLKPNLGSKYLFKNISFESMYLPALNDVTELLKLPNSHSSIIKFAEAMFDKKLAISLSSKNNLGSRGVGKKTFNKITDWLESFDIPFHLLLQRSLCKKVMKSVKVNSNAHSYFCALHGYKVSKNNDYVMDLLQWLNLRADLDYVLMDKISALNEHKQPDKDNHPVLWLTLKEHWQSHSLVPEEQLNVLIKLFYSANNNLSEAEVNELALFEAFHYLSFDFYLSAIANFEISIYNYLLRSNSEFKPKYDTSFFTRVITCYLGKGNSYSLFYAALFEFMKVISNENKPIGMLKFTSYIPLDKTSNSGETVNDRQYNQLKDWRKGENLPSFEKLSKLIEAALDDHGSDGLIIWLDIFRIARGLDTKIKECSQVINDERALLILQNVISQYPKYFAYFNELTKNKNSH